MTQLGPNVAGRWIVGHETIYRYDTAVAFAPHVLRLTPRPERVRSLARSVQVTPTPLSLTDFSDEFGNTCTRVVFGSVPSSELVIASRVELETFARPVFDSSTVPPLPWYQFGLDHLFSYRQLGSSVQVASLAHRLSFEAGSDPLRFFAHLCQTLYATLDRKIRLDGVAQTPDETLTRGGGACRDLTVLYLAACRCLGVAGRFVSGYQGQEASPDGKRHLHAWPEVFVPGMGWLGWDPMHGVEVGPGHVPLCAAPEQAGTMPVEGGFYFGGATVTSTLSYSISFAPL
jgi:transglutaminase-like putative cysteine protease